MFRFGHQICQLFSEQIIPIGNLVNLVTIHFLIDINIIFRQHFIKYIEMIRFLTLIFSI